MILITNGKKIDVDHLSTYISNIRKGSTRKNPETMKKSVGFFWDYNIRDIVLIDDNDDFKKEMKKFKNLCKNKKIEVLECNNLTHTTEKGDDVHCFVVQPKDNDNFPSFEVISLCFDAHVSGYAYFFYCKKNRDNMYNYITASK